MRVLVFQFDEVCESGALATLPQIRIEVMKESSAAGGSEAPLTVADAALAWLREQAATERDVSVSCHHCSVVSCDVAISYLVVLVSVLGAVLAHAPRVRGRARRAA